MKVKCKICRKKGFHDEMKVYEFWASQFLFVSKFFKKKIKSYYICRGCVMDVLSSLESEQRRIGDLYKPEIKEKKRKNEHQAK